MTKNTPIAIIGGGLAGLTAAFLLAKSGREIFLVEKQSYPFHKVCGEYVSNEVKPFLQHLGLFPFELQPSNISKFLLTSPSGAKVELPLDLGGFGISRHAFDHFLYQRCQQAGVKFLLQEQVTAIVYEAGSDSFQLDLRSGQSLTTGHVLGAFGKRSKIDKQLNRPFIEKRSDFIGVKYHVQTDFPADTVALHNYSGGYLGINQVENGAFNVCYLGSKQQLRETGSIEAMEKTYLHLNPWIKHLFENSKFLLEKPLVINEVNFSRKEPVVNHVLMIGDAGGLITPLCGNGMAIAIHSGKIAAEAILSHSDRQAAEADYVQHWKQLFSQRLWLGRNVQKLFGSNLSAALTVNLLKYAPFVGIKLMAHTHGKIISPTHHL